MGVPAQGTPPSQNDGQNRPVVGSGPPLNHSLIAYYRLSLNQKQCLNRRPFTMGKSGRIFFLKPGITVFLCIPGVNPEPGFGLEGPPQCKNIWALTPGSPWKMPKGLESG